jgi:hypothetical protein
VRSSLQVAQFTESQHDDGEGDEEEVIEFDHVCVCGHLVAQHHYSFTVNMTNQTQEYTMNCLLCGKGTASASFAPKSAAVDVVEQRAADEPDVASVEFNLSSKIKASHHDDIAHSDWDDSDAALHAFATGADFCTSASAQHQHTHHHEHHHEHHHSHAHHHLHASGSAVSDQSDPQSDKPVVGLTLASTLDSMLMKFEQDPKYLEMMRRFQEFHE